MKLSLYMSMMLGLQISLTAFTSTLFGQENNDREAVSFNRDIKPILSDRCFLCHGPDQSGPQSQETGLRLDQRDSAVKYGVFDFDAPADSELIRRVLSTDDDRMPPLESHKKSLSKTEVATLVRWIDQNATYEKHWAYVSPKRPTIPKVVVENRRTIHPVDAFVRHRLNETADVRDKLSPSKTADRQTLIRRATFDLIGLPPSPKDVQAFVKDAATDDEAFEKVIDRLLASPAYGEHRARYWLDAARYADTSGYQYDFERTQWVWRDWVIHAFNSNMPFDQFTIQQLAGDLIENADPQSRLATGFNRNHPITIEGGVVDEEYRTEYVIDRVVTTSTVFLGQTFLCARCHDHKYDPISQQDFYQFYAFFNNVPEKGLNGFAPQETISSPLAKEKIQLLQSELAEVRQDVIKLERPFERWAKEFESQPVQFVSPAPTKIQSSGGSDFGIQADGSVLFSGNNPATDDYTFLYALDELDIDQPSIQSIRLEALVDDSLNQRTGRASNGNFVLSEIKVEWKGHDKDAFTPIKILNATADHQQKGYPITAAFDGNLKRVGWAVDGNTRHENRTAIFALENPLPTNNGQLRIKLLQRFGTSHQIGRVRLSFCASDKPLAADEFKKRTGDLTTTQQNLDYRKFLLERFGNEKDKALLTKWNTRREAYDAASRFPNTMIMRERDDPRSTYVLERGEYNRPQKDRPLEPGIPAALGSLKDYPKDRLGLAKWLVSSEQPLTARVTVNRFWQQLFGRGLVDTSEDFGSQGSYPTHPDLLDWLAVEFTESGWDVKALLKTIMMSATYRQSSVVTAEQLELDPNNEWLSRGPRVRHDGEVIRDAALAVAGLLDPTVGGPSVYPYHPNGLWEEINNRPGFSKIYPHSLQPDDLYRRSMYTFWKRAVPPPSISTFDAPSREYCVVRRSRTNTPLQAFVMLHDPQFVEAARALAVNTLQLQRSDGRDLKSEERINHIFQQCLARDASTKEQELLKTALNKSMGQLKSAPDQVTAILAVGRALPDSSLDRVEVAAWTQVTRAVMNLSEFVTKE
ncbi:MAG: PSD1 and planctomycete cytochrome C domain-containing protein [Planctomycetota bacterium]